MVNEESQELLDRAMKSADGIMFLGIIRDEATPELLEHLGTSRQLLYDDIRTLADFWANDPGRV